MHTPRSVVAAANVRFTPRVGSLRCAPIWGRRIAPAGILLILGGLLLLPVARVTGGVIYETTSAYHRIQVVDQRGLRTLSFNGTEETRMSLANPLQGHFQYIEYFFMPWCWNTNLTNVLMVGLGGGSVQRLYAAHCPNVSIDTAEIDPTVREVAEKYFRYEPGPRQRVFVEDGRVFLRRSTTRYGAIVMDAYRKGRYGSGIPAHLATQEFFKLAREHLTDDGVLAYNVIGSVGGYRAEIVGSIYRTMQTVFPHVYVFPAPDSINVVMVGTVAEYPVTMAWLLDRARAVSESGAVALPTLTQRVRAFRALPPPNLPQCPVLTDDYAPVDGLLGE
ncbi:MAG: fused MFS/spermidine synthase [Verrucomicrobiales bacterium]|nr:fused MFS/spermidine synthase [Verrucomicrobiales bacterium]